MLSISELLIMGFIPFIVGDIVKILVRHKEVMAWGQLNVH